MTENDKTKIAIRMEYCKLTGEYFLDNIAKYCDFLEFKLIQYENDKQAQKDISSKKKL